MKGVVAAYPDDVFDRLCSSKYSSCYQVAFRESMVKYQGGPTAIEINGVSTPPGSARLNYSFIVLLLSLGVPVSVRNRSCFHSILLTSSVVSQESSHDPAAMH